MITRDPDHFHTDFHYNISEQLPFCTEKKVEPSSKLVAYIRIEYE